MSGRQAKVLREQADLYGIPFGEATIDLVKVAKALHDFLARKARVLAAAETDDPLLVGESSPALERYRDEKAKLARLDRLEREGQLIARDQIHDALARVASVLRNAGETLQRSYGLDAHRILDEALNDAQAEVDALFLSGNHGPIAQPEPSPESCA